MNQLKSITVIKNFLEAENKRDWTVWSSFLDPLVEYHVVGSETVINGAEKYMSHMQKVYNDLYDWHFEIVNIFGNDRVIMVEFDGKGHFSGEHNGRKYTNAPLHLEAICIFTLNDKKILKVKEYWDPVGYQRELG